MSGINYVTKALSNSKVWKSISRGECNLSQLKELYPDFPKETASATHIIGELHNGKTEEFLIYKDKLGKNLGSLTERADKSHIFIQIEDFFGNESKRFTKAVYDSEDNINEMETTIMKYFKLKLDDFKIDTVYVDITRNKKKYNNNVLELFQEIVEGLNLLSKKWIKSLSHMNRKTGETKLLTVSHSDNVNIDTSNPYFKTILMDSECTLASTYADIAKKHGVLDIKPPICFTNWDEMPLDMMNCLGFCFEDNSQIVIRNDMSKPMIIGALAHECEHAFVQNKNIHLAKLQNLKSTDPDSIKFFEGIESRFKAIDEGSIEYKKAQEYNDELLNYKNLVDEIGHDNLTIEKEANVAGKAAEEEYFACNREMKNNFYYSDGPIMHYKHNLWWVGV